jgi:hypothetical protein
MPVLIVLSLFFITFFSTSTPEFKDENLLRLQPFTVLFPFIFLSIFLVIFKLLLKRFFRLPDLKHELSLKSYLLVIALSFILFLIVFDISFYFEALFHEIGHALSMIEFSPKVYVYLSFPLPSGPYGMPTTVSKQINLALSFYRQFIMPLAGVLMEIIVFCLFSSIIFLSKWKSEYMILKEKLTTIKNKLSYFIFPKNITLENSTFPISPDLIRYLFFILISSTLFNWVLCRQGSDIIAFYKIIGWNGYLVIQQIFSNSLILVIIAIISNSLIFLCLTSLIFHQIENFIAKNKKLYLYTFGMFIFLLILFLFIYFQWGNLQIQF